MRIGIIIPSYQAENALLDIVTQLGSALGNKSHVTQIVVVDDGSDSENSAEVFSALSQLEYVTLLQHKTNQGKGAAIKTGLKFAAAENWDIAITADADGQHEVSDILSVLDHTVSTDGFVIGSRKFDQATPLRSRFGNTLTAILFRTLFNMRLSDTQSGLRGIPKRLFPALLAIPQNRYEYEFQSLINICKTEDIHEHPISTIYEAGNPTSHFRPIIDSALIYLVLLRYVLVTMCIAGLDIAGFFLLSKIVPPMIAFVCVRTVTVILYFFIVRNFVFKSNTGVIGQTVKFVALVLVNIFIVGFVVSYLENVLAIPLIVVYLLSTLILFGINFLVQRYVIFRD